jgi:hypothetical protein
MKSFSKFLQEAYINEEETRQGSLLTRSGKPQDFRNPKKTPFTATDPTPTPASRRLPAAQPSGASRTSPGQLEIPAPGERTTRVPSSQISGGEARQGSLLTRSGKPQNFTNPNRTPFTATDPTPAPASRRLPAAQPSGASRTSPGQMEIDFNARPNRGGALATRPVSTPSAPVGTPSNPQRINPTPVSRSTPSTPTRALPSATSRALPAAGQTTAVSRSQRALDAAKTQWAKPGAKPGLVGRGLGVAGSALDAGLEYAGQKERGRSTASAATMGATKAAGGWAGAAGGAKAGAALGAGVGALFGGVGAAPGAAIGGLVGGIAGYTAGSELTGKASETVAGATGKEKAAMAQANRQRQAGSAVKGIGGKTTFSQTKPGGPAFMSTGSGSQRKTVQLAKTGVVQRGGQSTAGHLAFQTINGKKQAVYKAGPSAQSLARTSSNPLERVGRSLFAGAYKKHDAAKAQQALQKARQADTARNKKLGVKLKPGG